MRSARCGTSAGASGMKTRLVIVFIFSLFAAALTAASPASAQAWPARAVTIVAPYGPGGTTDILARSVAEGMRGPLGQSVVIENVAGASGTIGVGRVARAAPDRSEEHTSELQSPYVISY